ncbi:hypothetical protein CJD50_17660 [Hafnia paralvei]|uniref:Uncharacterized protein n=1 Tax=Hafnia paralvei TaxID=546367 RepID=A0A2A2M922_9GAMM|nr:hypothetical protein [Hafnia paralvei]PAV95265.1 hypothetical protein CJD50_17660 [Hafnia paralvei]
MPSNAKERECFILSVHHCTREKNFIEFFRPDNSGYALRLHAAGRYTAQQVMGHLGYYNDGHCNIAVPCDVIESLSSPAPDGYFDDNGGVVVLNNAKNWRKAIKSAVAKPKYEPKPEYPRARRSKEQSND